MDQLQPLWLSSGKILMFFLMHFCRNSNMLRFLNRKTAPEYLAQVQKLIDNENITTDMSSYTIFMNLLGKVLKRLVESDAKNRIMKIIGKKKRFFSLPERRI